MIGSISRRIRLWWLLLTQQDIRALYLAKELLMADFSAFDAALDRVVAKSQADAAALATAESDAANLQAEIDARTAKLDAVAPAPAADPAAEAEQPV